MIMSWIWTGIAGISLFCALLTGQGSALASACIRGAQAGLELAIAIGGSLCLWSGLGALMEKTGISDGIAKGFRPLLHLVFPSSRKDSLLAGTLSANICANFLGLGNAATPMGIRAAKRLNRNGTATDELCRLIVLNTASIQLIPANVAAIRAGLGCAAPFDILPAVWVTSVCSAGLGLALCGLLGRISRQ